MYVYISMLENIDCTELIPEMIGKLLRELEQLPPVNYNKNLVTVIF